MKIAFHSNQLSERGTEVALFKYAYYNEKILGNKSIIISSSNTNNRVQEKFNIFDTFLYNGQCTDGGSNLYIKHEIESICIQEKVDVIYMIKAGEFDGLEFDGFKTVIHCVFRMIQPHGSVYAGVSEYISKKYNKLIWVDHIIEKEDNTEEDLKKELNIPKNALVLGRHGGADTFNLPIYDTIAKALEKRKNLYFIFLNTNKFIQHERVIFLPMSINDTYKAKFINTCDGMIHARADGETFGLAIAEFSVRNKPVITWKPSNFVSFYDTAHISLLKDEAYYYSNEADLLNILLNLNKLDINNKSWGSYTKEYAPTKVMKKFKNVFL